MSTNARGAARRIVAESEGARREREQHELEQQYNAPAWTGDNRKRPPGQQDVETIRRLDNAEWEAFDAVSELLRDGTPFGKVMEAVSEAGANNNERIMFQVSKAIASGRADVREWFSRLADALETLLDASRMAEEADPDKIRYNGFKPKNQ